MKNEFFDTDVEPLDQAKIKAQRALQELPTLSVRSVISLGFALWFILSIGITIASFIILTKIEAKQYFMESAGGYIFKLREARRFEKNYFLYETNLDDALKQVRLAHDILELNSGKMVAVVGEQPFQIMVHHINRYEDQLHALKKMDKEQRPVASESDQSRIEDELRKHGAEMVAAAEDLLARERKSFNDLIYLSKRGPMVFLIVLLGLMIFCSNFITRQMMRPLKELMDATHRIADGDITTPVLPVRRYRDEFTELSIAMNQMMHELSQRQEQLLKAHKLKAIGTLTAGVAHELNNPINNIMLTAAMLQEDYFEIDDDERQEMINDLVEQTDRSQKIIRNLLEFARENAIDTSLLQIDDILEESLQLVASQLKLNKVKIESRFAANQEPVSGDKQQLTQVFLNLALNAIHAMPNGGTLTIETDTIKEGSYLKIDFKDSGIGIADHVKSHIFDPFFTTKSQGEGTGLGLSVSLGIIRNHGGDIKVESRINKGTTFSVVLPIAKIPA